jgi:hypothetical protein
MTHDAVRDWLAGWPPYTHTHLLLLYGCLPVDLQVAQRPHSILNLTGAHQVLHHASAKMHQQKNTGEMIGWGGRGFSRPE